MSEPTRIVVTIRRGGMLFAKQAAMKRSSIGMVKIALILLCGLMASSDSAHADEGTPNGNFAAYTLTGPDPEALKAWAESGGGKILRRLRYHSGWVVQLEDASALQMRQMLRWQIRGNDDEILLEKDGVVRAADLAPDAVEFAAQTLPWGVDAVHAPEMHSTTRGKNVIVCIADTGVQRDHPDLEENLIGGENTVWGPASRWSDDNGHGTHVAGTVAAEDNGFGVTGIAPDAKIFAAKVLDSSGTGSYSSLAEGIRSCMAHGAQVINMSLLYPTDHSLIRRAIEDAKHEGIVLVAAAGNSGGPVGYPAKYPEVIAVSAITPEKKLASFSNRGPEIAFAAPGTKILSTALGGKYASLQGTSMATPHVSGVAALVLAAGRGKLRGEDLGLPAHHQGAGCINAQKSLVFLERDR